MLKQSFSRMKTVFSILLAVLFVTSLSAVGAKAHVGSHWGWGGWGYGPGCMWVGGNNWLCPAFSGMFPGMPYTIQTTAPASTASASPS
jgi:hypothetical protein